MSVTRELSALLERVRQRPHPGPVQVRRLERQEARPGLLGGGRDLGGFFRQAVVAVVADGLAAIAGP